MRTFRRAVAVRGFALLGWIFGCDFTLMLPGLFEETR